MLKLQCSWLSCSLSVCRKDVRVFYYCYYYYYCCSCERGFESHFWHRMWRDMPLKTPFRLLISFITILQVVTTITFYTVTYLHSLHTNLFNLSAVVFACSVSLSLKHLKHSSTLLHFLWLSPTQNCSVAPIVFKITTDSTENGRSSVESSFIEPLPSNGHGTDPQKTSYVISSKRLYWRWLLPSNEQ
jgi:hypothetical protein